MGLFDYLRCEMDLPETPEPPPSRDFQTKDTPDQYMTVYTITKDGQLAWRPYKTEMVPKAERPYPDDDGLLGLCGSVRRIEEPPTFLDFHGDINFYEHGTGGAWWEYRARFTEGRCAKITLVEYTPAASEAAA